MNQTKLILIPTELELNLVASELASIPGSQIEMCGFGPIVAAARTAHLLAKISPSAVLLLGIAGSLDGRLRIGHAYLFDEVACYGVGAGSDAAFRTAGELGWRAWPAQPEVGDVVSLWPNSKALQLLTCCAASADQHDVAARLQKFPSAVAEDMEGFAVAAACRLVGVPLQIVRGISNQAGIRDLSQWQIEEAMISAGNLAKQVLL